MMKTTTYQYDIKHTGEEMDRADMTDKLFEQIKAVKRVGPVEDDVATVMSEYLNAMEARILADAEVIKAAEVENARLRGALTETAEHLFAAAAEGSHKRYDERLVVFRRARAALEEKQDDE